MAQLLPSPAEAFIITLPAIVKARPGAESERIIECEVSNEETDIEGDVIDQKALLDSASSFLRNGHVDLDHGSELHARLNLPGVPSDWIIGYPKEVNDLGGGRTGTVIELLHGDPSSKAEAVWRGIKGGVRYRASIYGFPKEGMVEDCREKSCTSGATRYHIKGLDWKSLALTTSPINDSIRGFVKIVSAKAYIAELLKGGTSPMPPAMYLGDGASLNSPPQVPPFDLNGGSPFVTQSGPNAAETPVPLAQSSFLPHPRTLADALGQYHSHMSRDCPHCDGLNTTPGFKAHFMLCCGMHPDLADLFSHALMHWLLLNRRRTRGSK